MTSIIDRIKKSLFDFFFEDDEENNPTGKTHNENLSETKKHIDKSEIYRIEDQKAKDKRLSEYLAEEYKRRQKFEEKLLKEIQEKRRAEEKITESVHQGARLPFDITDTKTDKKLLAEAQEKRKIVETWMIDNTQKPAYRTPLIIESNYPESDKWIQPTNEDGDIICAAYGCGKRLKGLGVYQGRNGKYYCEHHRLPESRGDDGEAIESTGSIIYHSNGTSEFRH